MGGSYHLDPVFAWVLRSSAEASVIVALILLAQLLLRHRLAARWRYCLWLILLVRLVMPWMPESRASVFNVVPGFEGGGLISLDGRSSMNLTLYAGNAALHAPVLKDPATRTWPAMAMLKILWLVGAAAFTTHIVYENLRFWRQIRNAGPPEPSETLALLDRCRRTLGIRSSVSLVNTDAVTSPALFGILKPTILLPQGMAATLAADELRYVFLHELAHLKRRDIVVNWLMTFLQALHWFNPVIWYAFHRMRTDREFACDALALSYAAPDESRAYGRTIINLLDRVYTLRRVPGMAGILEDSSQLKRRITMIALFTKNSYRLSLLAVVALAVLGAATLTKAKGNGEIIPVESQEAGHALALSNCRGTGDGLMNFTAEELQMDRATGEIRLAGVHAKRLMMSEDDETGALTGSVDGTEGAAETTDESEEAPRLGLSNLQFDGGATLDRHTQGGAANGNVRLTLQPCPDRPPLQIRADKAQWSAESMRLTGNVEVSHPDMTFTADSAHVDSEERVLVLTGNCRGSGERIAGLTADKVQVDLAKGGISLVGRVRMERVHISDDAMTVVNPVLESKPRRNEEQS